MQQNFNKAIQKAKEEINTVTSLDTQLLTIYQNFPQMSNDDKEEALERYEILLEEREEVVSEVLDIQSYLYSLIADLDNVKLTKIDKISHWSKLRRMKKTVNNLVDIVDDDSEVEGVVVPNIQKEIPIDKEKLQKTIAEIQQERKEQNSKKEQVP